MKKKKYELTDETIKIKDRTLFRIKRLSDNLIGGYIQSEKNLSQEGTCFVYDNAQVFDSAKIDGEASVFGNAKIYENASIYGCAMIYDNAEVFGNATIGDEALVYKNSKICENARLFDQVTATKFVLTAVTSNEHRVTITDNHIIIGCHCHRIEFWKRHIDSIGLINEYNIEEIQNVKKLINSLLISRDESETI